MPIRPVVASRQARTCAKSRMRRNRLTVYHPYAHYNYPPRRLPLQQRLPPPGLTAASPFTTCSGWGVPRRMDILPLTWPPWFRLSSSAALACNPGLMAPPAPNGT
jgi:hypothetical protein